MGDRFNQGHFIEPATALQRRQLFVDSVTAVILEITGHCNRRCSYCPVSLVPRVRQKDVMDEAVLDRIIRDLVAVSYAGSICLNLYNEPLSDKPFLLGVVRRMRAEMPNAYIYFSTNGDYLDREYLDALADAGLSALTISIHTTPGKSYDIAEAMSRTTELSADLRAGMKLSRLTDSDAMGTLNYKRLPVTVFSRDFEKHGVDRAGSMKNVNVPHKRTSPCERPFDTFNVDFMGNVYPCCMFYPDLPSSEGARTGHVLGFETIFDAYSAQAVANWRREVFTFGDKKSPCDTCLEAEQEPTDAAVASRQDLAIAFGLQRAANPEPAPVPEPRKRVWWGARR